MAKLFFWLLLGDLGMSVMLVALPQLLPLQLHKMGVEPQRMAWMLSLGPLASLLLSPFIGVWSDRLRTRWGRRRPFLLTSTPILAVGLLLIPHIQNYYLLCFVILIVQICNVLETVLYYLYADVVPSQFMGRFMAAFRIVGNIGILSFQFFLLPHFDSSPVWVWTICGVGYFITYQVSLHCVKEGEYPPPAVETRLAMTRDFIKEGLGSRYIWLLWFALGMIALATPAGYFRDLFAKANIGLDMRAIGQMNALATFLSIFVMLPSGWLIDKYGPRIVWGVMGGLLGVMNLAAFFFVRDPQSMQFYYIINGVLGGLLTVALMPMLYAHLPKQKFGQLVAMQSMVVQTLIFVSTNGLGFIISQADSDYRISILYPVPFLLLIPLAVWLLSKSRSPFHGMEMAMIDPADAKAS